MGYDDSQQNIQILAKEYAEGTRRTVVFMGAGGSTEVGLPTWFELRSRLFEKISTSVNIEIAEDYVVRNYRTLEEFHERNDKFWEFFSCAEENWPTVCKDFWEDQFDSLIPSLPIPNLYKKIWNMKHVRQVFTLNVDGLLTKAFREVYSDPNKNQILEYDGFNTTDSLSYINRNNFCIVNLHGIYYQKSRWVMNDDQRKRLIKGDPGTKYTHYVTRIFSEYNVLFIGVNPEDVAISSFISKSLELGISGRHYWLCPTPTGKTYSWAEQHGVKIISYSPEKNGAGEYVHSHDIISILEQIDNYVSKDDAVNLPDSVSPIDPKLLEKKEDLIGNLITDRRNCIERLSGAITYISKNYGYSSANMKKFMEEYSVALQISATVNDKTEGFNTVANYKIIQNMQSSGISSVWNATNTSESDSPYYALKILGNSGINDITERLSFRRGIESIYLLNDSNDRVAPRYITHFEAPLSVVMENIEGNSLKDFIDEKYNDISIDDSLKIYYKICNSLLSCHKSRANVLHRDVKPGNILIEGWFIGYDLSYAVSSSIRLINFDLSWHKFTSGNTKSISADDIGYYAPEQRYIKNSSPPRTAATDVYMLGMILYFIISGENPPEGGSSLSGWEEKIHDKCRKNIHEKLTSKRIARLIIDMTRINDLDRPDLNSVCGNLETMISWIAKDYSKIDDDLIVEYLAICTEKDYVWDTSSLCAEILSVQSTNFKLSYEQNRKRVNFSFNRQKSDSDNRAKFGEKMRERISSSVEILRKSGWHAQPESNKGINANISIYDLRREEDFDSKIWGNISNQLLSSFL